MLLQSIFSFFSKLFLFTGKLKSSREFTFEKKLTKEEETLYFTRLHSAKLNGTKDTQAEEILAKHNLRLVAHIAKKYKSGYSDADDLISIGSIGLIKAIRSFDITKAKNFSSFASVCIENEILMVLRSEKKLSHEQSLSSPLGVDADGNELSLSDILCDDKVNLEETADKNAAFDKIKALAKSKLDDRENLIINLRFGLDGSYPKTQKEVAAEMGISRSYISRIEKAAILKLKQALKWNSAIEGDTSRHKLNFFRLKVWGQNADGHRFQEWKLKSEKWKTTSLGSSLARKDIKIKSPMGAFYLFFAVFIEEINIAFNSLHWLINS